MNVFDIFPIYSGLKPNKSKCEIADKGVNGTLWNWMYRSDKNLLKTLGIHFSYDKKIENEENFIKLIKKIENVLKIWRIRNLTVQGQITIFKTLTIFKIILFTLL